MYTNGKGTEIMNYRQMYHVLFNAITDALRLLCSNDPSAAAWALISAQRQTEEMYISGRGKRRVLQ